MFNSIKSLVNLQPFIEYTKTLKYKHDDTTVLMAHAPSTPVKDFLDNYLTIKKEIEEYRKSKIKYIMVNTILPGTEVPIHTDTLPYQLHHERWHLVLTGDKSIWWDEENGEHILIPGYWYGPMKYWINHSVANRGTIARTHLILDLERIHGN